MMDEHRASEPARVLVVSASTYAELVAENPGFADVDRTDDVVALIWLGREHACCPLPEVDRMAEALGLDLDTIPSPASANPKDDVSTAYADSREAT